MSKLTLVAGPIGNLGDVTQRLKDTLASCDAVLAEDKRVTGKLLILLGVKKPLITLNEFTKENTLNELIKEIKEGKHFALLTDAGTPTISDPGAKLVDLCHENEIEVDGIPGPSAITQSLMLSGFFAQQFVFVGFFPKKAGDVEKMLVPFKDSTITIVGFESPHRIHKTLKFLADTCPERRYCICREMTKLHQQIYRSQFPQVPNIDDVPAKGEFTLVIEGYRRNANKP